MRHLSNEPRLPLASDLRSALPPHDCFKLTRMIQAYGADHVAAAHCGLSHPPSFFDGSWQHGWIPKFCQFDPVYVLCEPPTSGKSQQVFVARRDEEEYLRESGFSNAYAIGLPFVYESGNPVVRKPDSLLIMPTHSLDYTTHKWPEEEYLAELEKVRGDFSEVLVCVHPSCLKHGYWVQIFRKAGIPIVAGPDIRDRNGLCRLHTILSRFEYMTTNGLGSHVVYAAARGLKVSIFGPFAEFDANSTSNIPYYSENPHLVQQLVTIRSESNIRQQLPFLFCSPGEAAIHQEWGWREIGADNRQPPERLRILFGWNPTARWRRQGKSFIINFCLKHPKPAWHYVKLAMRAPYRRWSRERERLGELPQYQNGTTSLLDRPFEFVDAKSFLDAYEAIFEKEVYRFSTTLDKPLIIDGGANVGLSVLYFKRLYPNSRVVAFEPDPSVFATLRRNCEAFGLSDVELHQKALWLDNSSLTFQQEGGDSGRLAADAPCAENTVRVRTVRLRSLLREPTTFLKLDIEGAETEVLEDCRDSLGEVQNLFVEYHSFTDQEQSLPDLLDILRKAGFRVHIHHVNYSLQPFMHRKVEAGMDNCLNIFATR